MPTYDFRCSQCGATFEVKRSFAQFDEPAYCPTDGAPGERQLPSTMTVLSKGGSGGSGPAPIAPPTGHEHAHGHSHSHGPGSAPHSH